MLQERLKKLRKERGMTQLDLAKALDVSGGTVAMWETGKRRPQFDTLEKISELFGCSLGYVLGTTDDPTAVKPDDNTARVMGDWIVQEEYEDIFRKFAMLDEFGQKAVSAILRAEFARCQEQCTMRSGIGVSVSIRTRLVQDPINEDLPD